MAYRMRVQVNVDWCGQGAGPMTALTAPTLPGGGTAAQTLQVDSQTGGYIVFGTGTSGPAGNQIASADITTLLNSMTTDISAQLNLAANLAKMQNWSSGQP